MAQPNATGAYAYVTNYGNGTVSVIDMRSNRVVGTFVGFVNPGSIVANHNTPYVYVLDNGVETVYALDTRSNTATAVASDNACPASLTMRPQGADLYNGCSEGYQTIQTKNNAVKGYRARGIIPNNMYANPRRRMLYFGTGDGHFTAYNELTGFVANAVSTVAPLGYASNESGSLVYATTEYGEIFQIAASTNRIVAHVGLSSGDQAYAIALNPANERYLYAAQYYAGKLLKIDTDTMSIVGSIRVGHQPDAVTIDAAGTTAYVANSKSNTVSVVDLRRNAVTHTIPVGSEPRQIALRDRGSVLPASCHGVPDYVTVVPVGTNYFTVPTPTGYRLVGPQPQTFNASVYDCAGNPVSAINYSVTMGPGISLTGVSSSQFTLTASHPVGGSATLTITATGSGATIRNVQSIEASPAIYTSALPTGVRIFDWYGDATPPLPRTAFEKLRLALGVAIAYDALDGNLYVVDGNGAIDVFNQVGHFIRQIRLSQKLLAFYLVIDPSGKHLYASGELATKEGWVVELDQNGRVLSGKDAFKDATSAGGGAIALSPTGDRLYSLNAAAGKLMAFDATGQFVRSASVPPPGNIAVSRDNGDIAVLNKGGTGIILYRSNLSLKGRLTGGLPQAYAMTYEPFRDYLYAFDYYAFPHTPAVTVFSPGGKNVNLLPHDSFEPFPQNITSVTVVP